MPAQLNETVIMLVVLGLIDVVMITNLLIMVIVGGYETFVSRMNLQDHPDQPEWLSHVNASVLKVKLATAIIGIRSIHLLKTFINAENYTEKKMMWQTSIHVAFLFSALAIAAADRIMRAAGGTQPPAKPDDATAADRAGRVRSSLVNRHDDNDPRSDLIDSVAGALQYISYYHPADYIEHLARAYEREQSPAAQRRDRADPDQLADVRARATGRSARTRASSTSS